MLPAANSRTQTKLAAFDPKRRPSVAASDLRPLLTVFHAATGPNSLPAMLGQQRFSIAWPLGKTVQLVVNTLATVAGWATAGRRTGRKSPPTCAFPFPQPLRQIVKPSAGDDRRADPCVPPNLVWPLLSSCPNWWQKRPAPPVGRWLEGRSDRAGPDGPLWQRSGDAGFLRRPQLYRPNSKSAWLQALTMATARALPPCSWQAPALRPMTASGESHLGLRVSRPSNGWAKHRPHRTGLVGPLACSASAASAPSSGATAAKPSAAPCRWISYLLTPAAGNLCNAAGTRRELSDAIFLGGAFAAHWVEKQAPGLRPLRRLGGEFQQLLEGTRSPAGRSSERDLFFLRERAASRAGPVTICWSNSRSKNVDTSHTSPEAGARDQSLEVHPCPGRCARLQIVRDRAAATDGDYWPAPNQRHILW